MIFNYNIAAHIASFTHRHILAVSREKPVGSPTVEDKNKKERIKNDRALNK